MRKMQGIVYFAFGVFTAAVISGTDNWINKEELVEKAKVVQEIKPGIEVYGGAVSIFDVKSPEGKNCVLAVYAPRGIAIHCY